MLSYWRGPDQPLWEKTIGQMLDAAVEQWGDDFSPGLLPSVEAL